MGVRQDAPVNETIVPPAFYEIVKFGVRVGLFAEKNPPPLLRSRKVGGWIRENQIGGFETEGRRPLFRDDPKDKMAVFHHCFFPNLDSSGIGDFHGFHLAFKILQSNGPSFHGRYRARRRQDFLDG